MDIIAAALRGPLGYRYDRPNRNVRLSQVVAIGSARKVKESNSGTSSMMEKELVARAIARDDDAIKRLVESITPVIQSAITMLFVKSGQIQKLQNPRADIADHCQDVLLSLFKDDAKVLRRWDPERGMQLNSFVSLVARRKVISSLRSEKIHYRIDDRMVSDSVDHMLTSQPLDEQVGERRLILQIIKKLRNEVSELGFNIFMDVFLYEKSIDDISSEHSVSKNAVYVWCNRLRKKAKAISESIEQLSDVTFAKSLLKENPIMQDKEMDSTADSDKVFSFTPRILLRRDKNNKPKPDSKDPENSVTALAMRRRIKRCKE